MTEHRDPTATIDIDASFEDLCDAELWFDWTPRSCAQADARDARYAAVESLLELSRC